MTTLFALVCILATCSASLTDRQVDNHLERIGTSAWSIRFIAFQLFPWLCIEKWPHGECTYSGHMWCACFHTCRDEYVHVLVEAYVSALHWLRPRSCQHRRLWRLRTERQNYKGESRGGEVGWRSQDSRDEQQGRGQSREGEGANFSSKMVLVAQFNCAFWSADRDCDQGGWEEGARQWEQGERGRCGSQRRGSKGERHTSIVVTYFELATLLISITCPPLWCMANVVEL